YQKASVSVTKREILSKNREILDSLYRLAQSKNDAQSIVSNWRWYLRLWNSKEHGEFDRLMQKCWYDVQDHFCTMCSEAFFPYSPRTIPFSPEEIKGMKYMGIDWKDYLPDSKKKPVISSMELKEKISKMSEEEYKKMEKDFMLKTYSHPQL
ncbi:MAG: hypothetical protein RRY13_05895, partial [Akkermansia sp.]